MNSIPETQNSDEALRLMRAREQTYREARMFQVFQLICTVVLPSIFAILAISFPTLRAVFAATSLALLVLDVAVLDRAQGKLLKRAAKIAEQFDCLVLSLKWNDFIADKHVDPEDIVRASSRFPAGDVDRLRDWYPVAVGRAPLAVARIACQITNLRYDAELRRTYSSAVTALPFLVTILATAVLLTTSLPFEAVVLSILAPAAPLVVWALREGFRHRDTAAKQDELKLVAEKFWTTVKSCPSEECERRTREFQDAIYARRVSSPLIFPFVYSRRRPSMEAEMNLGADMRLREIGL